MTQEPILKDETIPPIHQLRYARAWELYQDHKLSDYAQRVLEDEMDSAQNDFTFPEFQTFKRTLPGFVEHWNEKMQQILERLENAR